MNIKSCEKCGAKWIDSKLFWATGKSGTDEDLAGLVCNQLDPSDVGLCINGKRGVTTGQTWEYRRGWIDGVISEIERTKPNDSINWSI